MKRKGQALCHGAISILNAFATNKGGALGIDLWTRARVTLSDDPGQLSAFNTSDPDQPKMLMLRTVERTLDHYGLNSKVSGEIITWSTIPTAVGLKSSSAAANAIVLATTSALGHDPEDDVVLGIASEASRDAGASLTGAYDDAYACYHGGGVITDNSLRKVEKKFQCPAGTRVLILVPPKTRHTSQLTRSMFEPVRSIAEIAYREACDSSLWQAMTLNSLAYSAVLGEDQRPVVAALRNGAFAAGLSGKGPAVAAIVEENRAAEVRNAFEKFEGKIIEALPNVEKAVVEV